MKFALLSLALLSACSSTSWDGDDGLFDTGYDSYSWASEPTYTTAAWRQTGESWSRVEGVGFRNEDDAWVGLSGMLCKMGTDGALKRDLDPIPGTERVSDVDEVIVVQDEETDEVIVLRRNGEPLVNRHLPGLVVARGDSKRDVIALVDDPEAGCAVAFHQGRTRTLVTVPASPCPDREGFAVDRERGVAYVGSPSAVYEVKPTGAAALEAAGDLVAWHEDAGRLYVATRFEGRVSAWLDGSMLWSVDAEAEVTLLRAMRGEDAVAAVVDLPNGAAEVLVFDGKTGTPVRAIASSQRIDDVAVSPSGQGMALSHASGLDFFRRR